MKTSKKALTFPEMPREYGALCALLLPRPIHDQVAYANALEIADGFAGFEDRMSPDQADYFTMLCGLIADYDEERLTRLPKRTPRAMLKHLAEEHGLAGADLSRILGASRQLGPMILRGDRKITAEHASALGKHFGVSPALFIE